MTEEATQNLDYRLREAVLSCLGDEALSFIGLRVGVLNGIVHLAGAAPSLEIRQKAVELVEQIPGVRGVVNRIDAPGAPLPARSVNLNLGKDK